MTIPTPGALAASCRAFALQCKPFGVSGVLNEAADLIQQQQATIERLSAFAESLADRNDSIGDDARTALGKDEQ